MSLVCEPKAAQARRGNLVRLETKAKSNLDPSNSKIDQSHARPPLHSYFSSTIKGISWNTPRYPYSLPLKELSKTPKYKKLKLQPMQPPLTHELPWQRIKVKNGE
ncbi:hypothetical protein LguiB_018075 [Lonicera macranthoides]